MTDNDKQEKLLNHTRDMLDKSIDSIDDDTARRLKQIRFQALEQKKIKPGWFKPLPAMAATAAVLVVAVSLWTTRPAELNDALALEDMPLLSAAEELEFYQELDFYNWLDDEQING